jgi:tRNA(fMet)-specific endonuclease VapC
MNYLLDTDICIYLIKKKPLRVLQKLTSHSVSQIGISSVTLAELEYGIEKSLYPEKNAEALRQFLIPLTLRAFDEAAAKAYGKIRSTLEKKGSVIGAMDMMIAAHALSLRTILVTNNTREFSRISSLELENWTR